MSKSDNPNRVQVYAGEPMRRLLAATGDESRSARVNSMADRYDAIIRDQLNRMDLTVDEWMAVLDANNGTVLDDGVGWQLCYANVWDSGDELDLKWNINRRHLTARLQAMDAAGRAAVAEVVDRFWGVRRGEATKVELLAACGVVVREAAP